MDRWCEAILSNHDGISGTQGPLPRWKLNRDQDLGLGRDLGLDKGQDPVIEVVAGQWQLLFSLKVLR